MRVDRVCHYLRRKADQFALTRIESASRTGRNASCSNEVKEGMLGATVDPGDCAPGAAEVDELAYFASLPSRHATPGDPFGRPGFFPDALAFARPSRVRSEMRSQQPWP